MIKYGFQSRLADTVFGYSQSISDRIMFKISVSFIISPIEKKKEELKRYHNVLSPVLF